MINKGGTSHRPCKPTFCLQKKRPIYRSLSPTVYSLPSTSPPRLLQGGVVIDRSEREGDLENGLFADQGNQQCVGVVFRAQMYMKNQQSVGVVVHACIVFPHICLPFLTFLHNIYTCLHFFHIIYYPPSTLFSSCLLPFCLL